MYFMLTALITCLKKKKLKNGYCFYKKHSFKKVLNIFNFINNYKINIKK